MLNVLILSCGTRNKIVQYFRACLEDKGHVITADASKMAPALYESSRNYIVPRVSSPTYINEVIRICKNESINGVISLIDTELSVLAQNQDRFNDINTIVIGSSYRICEMSLDKLQMYRWLNDNHYKCARTWDDKEKFFCEIQKGLVSYPVIIKPRKGSASISISVGYNNETVENLFNNYDDLLVQEYLDGREIGVDVYIDMISGEVVSIFTKEKIKMRAGETDKSISIKNDKLFLFIERFVSEVGYRGEIDIDVFEMNGEYYINEVNPRFGGGYPHAFECGCNHIELIINNLNGVINKRRIGNYEEGIVMMKYSDLVVKKHTELIDNKN